MFEELLRRRNGKLVLALEMFHRDDQPHLDAYSAGDISQGQLADEVRLWSNHRDAYEPLLQLARSWSAPVVGSNFPRSLLRRFASEGARVYESLTADERRLVPDRLFPNTDAHWRRVDNATRGHSGMMGASNDPDARLYSVQSLWDNAMGDACVPAVDDHPGHLVLHVNGGFHSAYGDGVVQQVRSREPTAELKTVAITPSISPATVRLTGTPAADYTAVVEARATNFEQGRRSVAVSRDVEYVLHTPDDRTANAPLPLLIWLADEGLTAEEVLPLCRKRYGDEALVVVVEAPHRMVGPDRAAGGRWFSQDSFAEDIGVLTVGVERIWAYVSRHFDVDQSRVCLAGEGEGATVVAAIAARTDRIGVEAVAIQPERYSKLTDLPLLLPEMYAAGVLPKRSLTVVAPAQEQSFWTKELDQYASAGVDTAFIAADLHTSSF